MKSTEYCEMTTALAMPQFINYPGTLPGQLPTSVTPVSVPVNSQMNSTLPVSTSNGSGNFGAVQMQSVQVPVVPVGGGYYNE